MKHILIVEPISKRIEVKSGASIYDALIALNYPIGALCGGKGTCGKCKILCVKNQENLSPLNVIEKNLLTPEEQKNNIRLACQSFIFGDTRISLLEGLISHGNKILIDSDLLAVRGNIQEKFDPFIKLMHLKIPLPTLHNNGDDLYRMTSIIRKSFPERVLHLSPIMIDNDLYTITRSMSTKIRSKEGKITLYYWLKDETLEILDVEEGYNKKLYGIAIDLGTTTIVGYLINLLSGDIVSISSMLNPQVSIGEDLITRISYICQNEAKHTAQTLLISALNQILTDTCEKAKVSKLDVKELVVVGNTGMHHMLYGLNSEQLARTPFVPVFKAPIYINSAQLGIQASPQGRLYSPPVVAGFVGTDTIGCIVSSRIDTYEKFSLLIDIGTNGELVMGNRKGLITGSCAAGSALEGAHISLGMRAAEGAIESLTIDPKSFHCTINTIGNLKPIGMCGSGLIDLIAEMIKCKIITRNGNFNVHNLPERVLYSSNGDLNYIIYDSEKDGIYFEDDRKKFTIGISQKDIRQLQLAKGAFLSGAYLLNKQYPSENLEQILLAGAFGSYIDKENARIIGLFPEITPTKIYQIGNAAGLGAQICLKDQNMRKFANEIANKVEYFEIASSKDFQKEFALSMYFPHYELHRFPSLRTIYQDLPIR
ncbi:MAG: DUF4445 domain-containing protein [Candidatus Lokiarchaeota archaeon]|nr:DUF4445 domain-containing protein [Candidatus Lokiarchaeota archaeon]